MIYTINSRHISKCNNDKRESKEVGNCLALFHVENNSIELFSEYNFNKIIFKDRDTICHHSFT